VRQGDLSTDLEVLLSVRGAVPYQVVIAPAGPAEAMTIVGWRA